MARLTVPLKDAKIKNTISSEKDQKLFDGNGLILLVKKYTYIEITKDDGTVEKHKKLGSKLWRFKYQFGGKTNTLSLGKYPEISLETARERVKQLRSEIAMGTDPSAKRKDEKKNIRLQVAHEKEKQTNLLTNIFKDFLIFKSHSVEAKQINNYESRMKNYVFPYLGDKPMEDISDDDIIQCIHNVPHVVTPKSHKSVNNKAETARRVFNICEQFWKWAKANKRIPHNVTLEIDINEIIPPAKGNNHYPKITDETILGELLRSIDAYPHSPIVRNALRLVAILPYRVENLSTLRWDMIDFDKRTLTIPRSEMKVDDSSLPDFILPLPDQAVSILKQTQEITGWGKWVFHGIKDFEDHMDEETCNKALRIMGFTDATQGKKQTTHSFRGTFRSLAATYAHVHKASFETCERVLDHHEKKQAIRAYIHMADYTEQMRPLLQWWADFLDKLRIIK